MKETSEALFLFPALSPADTTKTDSNQYNVRATPTAERGANGFTMLGTCCYMQVEAMAELNTQLNEAQPAQTACPNSTQGSPPIATSSMQEFTPH